MSEHLTHVAVFEDSVRLVKAARTEFPNIFIESLEMAYDSGVVCSGTRGNHLYAVPIIETYIGVSEEEKSQEILEQIAGAIGWLTHRASDLNMKPLFKIQEKKQSSVFPDQEADKYHDAFIFNEVYDRGKLNSESPWQVYSEGTLGKRLAPLKAVEYCDSGEIENLLTHYYISEIYTLHKNGESLSAEQFAEALIENSQDLYENLRDYITAAHEPDSHKLIEYIYRYNVYNKEDAIIKLARKIQREKIEPGVDEVIAAVSVPNQSHYANALKMAFEFIKAGGDFYSGRITKSTAYDIIKIAEKNRR